MLQAPTSEKAVTLKLLVIIPAYNEEECLANTVRELLRECPGVDYLVVNDGSLDHTPQICDKLRLNHVDLPVNTGLSSSFRCGMKYAWRHNYDAAVQFDADGQHVPQAVPLMAHAMEQEGANIVIASRGLAGGGRQRRQRRGRQTYQYAYQEDERTNHP